MTILNNESPSAVIERLRLWCQMSEPNRLVKYSSVHEVLSDSLAVCLEARRIITDFSECTRRGQECSGKMAITYDSAVAFLGSQAQREAK